jgi:hypothetical protein
MFEDVASRFARVDGVDRVHVQLKMTFNHLFATLYHFCVTDSAREPYFYLYFA